VTVSKSVLRAVLAACALAGILVSCAPKPPFDASEAPVGSAPPDGPATLTQRGIVSLYGHAFAGRKTANGEIFDPEALTMAHRTLPFGTRVRVTNLENRRSVDVVVNDRGPFVRDRIGDLSLAAARRIGMVSDGVVEATLEVVSSGASR
jgi:rare lipoprotein A